MTEPTGRRARWAAAAVLAPLSAATFAGTTVWAVGHDPLATSSAPQAAAAPAPVQDPAVAALAATVARSRAEVVRLQRSAKALRTKAARLTADARRLRREASALADSHAVIQVGSSSGGSSSGGSSSGRSTAGSSSSGGSSSGRTTVVVPAPAAPPSSQGSTGASGAP